jgi:hypothetical protein
MKEEKDSEMILAINYRLRFLSNSDAVVILTDTSSPDCLLIFNSNEFPTSTPTLDITSRTLLQRLPSTAVIKSPLK